MSFRSAAKRAAHAAASVLVAWPLASFRLRAHLLGPDRALEAATQNLAGRPGVSGDYLRRAFLRYAIAHCAPTATIGFGTMFSKVAARIDEDVVIGAQCHIGWVHLERGALVGPGCHLLSGARTHGSGDTGVPIRDQAMSFREIRIGEGAWIGSGAIVMADVGAHSVVAAGSVVAEPVPPYVVAGGVPARVLKRRPEPGPEGAQPQAAGVVS